MTEEYTKHSRKCFKSEELREKHAETLKREHDKLVHGDVGKYQTLDFYASLPHEHVQSYAMNLKNLMKLSEACKELETEKDVCDETKQNLEDAKNMVGSLHAKIMHSKHLDRIIVREDVGRLDR